MRVSGDDKDFKDSNDTSSSVNNANILEEHKFIC